MVSLCYEGPGRTGPRDTVFPATDREDGSVTVRRDRKLERFGRRERMDVTFMLDDEISSRRDSVLL